MEAPKVKQYPHTGVIALFLFVILLTAGQLGLAGSADKRPRIGLVLGGGGARGFAHLGVLKWFHENRVPVDYIAGTSMGGLVGGLYATGMEPKEMLEHLARLDWDTLLAPNAQFQDLSFRRKGDRRVFPNSIELGWKRGLKLSHALLSAHTTGLLIDRLTLPYSTVRSFDDLPIPFRCTAVDLLTGKRALLKDIPLSRALRATMAVPGAFPPVENGKQLLVDGGVLDNLPTRAVQKMGAQLIIAVDVSSPLKKQEELTSMVDILLQAIDIMVLENTLASRDRADCIIEPDLGSLTATDFDQAEALAELGCKAAEEQASYLKTYSLDPSEWRDYLGLRKSRGHKEQFQPEVVAACCTEKRAIREIEKRLKNHEGIPLKPGGPESELNAIHGSGRWSQLGYRGQRKDGQDILSIDVQEKRHGPPFVHLGIVANNSEADSVQFNLRSRLTFFDVGSYGSEWRVDASIGSRPSFATEYCRPFDSGFFLAPRLFAGRDLTNLYRNGQREAQYRTRFAGAGFDVGHHLENRRDELRLGFQVAHADGTVVVGDPLLPSLDGMISKAQVGWVHDGLDNPIVPRKGLGIELSGSWFFKSPGASTRFLQSELRVSNAVPLGQKNSLVMRLAGGSSFGNTAPPLQQFTLGGLSRLGGFGADEFRGSRYFLASPGYLHEVAELPLVVGKKVYITAWHDFGSVFERAGPRDYHNSASLGVVAETLIGPFFVGTSWGEAGRHKVYFSLGRLF